MKRYIFLILLFPVLLFSANILELLQDFRETHPLTPGTSTTSELQTNEYLTKEFRALLQENYFSTELKHGRIELTHQQIQHFAPYNWLQWRELMRKNTQTYDSQEQCDMTWLQVTIPATPDLLSRPMEHDWMADSSFTIFPALTGPLRPTLSFYDLLPSAEAEQLKQSIHSQTHCNATQLLNFPTSLILQTLEQVQAKADDCTPWLRHSWDFPGYHQTEAFNPSPVKIIQEFDTSNTTHTIVYSLHDNDTTILTWEGTLEYQSPLELQWYADYGWYSPDESILDLQYYPSFSYKCSSWDTSYPFGTQLQLTIQRKIKGLTTDTLTLPVRVGEKAVIAVNALSSYGSSHSLSQLRELQNQAIHLLCSATGYTCASQLQAIMLAEVPETDETGILTGTHALLTTHNGTGGYIPTFTDKSENNWLALASNIITNSIITKYLQSKNISITSPQEEIFNALQQGQELSISDTTDSLSIQYGSSATTWSNASIPVFFPLDQNYNLTTSSTSEKYYNLSPLFPAILLCQNIWEDSNLTNLEKLTAINTILVPASGQITLEDKITDTPELQVTTTVQYQDHLPNLYISAQISHSIPTTTCFILSQDSEIIQSKYLSSNNIDTSFIIPSAGTYLLTAITTDSQNNAAVHTQTITVPNENEPILPTLSIQVEGLNENMPVVNGPFVIRASANNMPQGSTIAIYLNDTLLAEESRTSTLRLAYDPTDWDEGPYYLIAFLDSAVPITAETTFYYSSLASDHVAPQLYLTPDAWPIQNATTLTLSAIDQTAVQSLTAFDSSQQLASVTRNTDEYPTTLTIHNLPLQTLENGFTATATDIFGNTATRVFQLSKTQITPVFDMESHIFDGKEHTESAQVAVITQNAIPDCVELFLNGKLYTRVCFPDTPYLIFSIDAQDAMDGLNSVEAVVWSGNLQSSQTQYFLTPPARDISISPTLVQPWKGTESIITFTATTLQPHAWSVHLSGGSYSTYVQGTTTDIHATFDTSGLPDGSYTITLFIPDLAAELPFSVTVDSVPCTPIAEITYPIENQVITEGMLILKGNVSATEETNQLSYSIQLQDAYGHQLPLQDVSTNAQYRLQATPFVPGEDAHDLPSKSCSAITGELARLDLSALPNAPYTLTLTASIDGQETSVSVPFTLSTVLKASYFTYTDPDFTVNLGTSTKVGRFYSTQTLEDTDFGYGWKLNTQATDPVINESRSEMETVDYDTISVRDGGTRDVTLTLSTGQRVTFVFSLQSGGGYTFCYYARWTPPAGVQATLCPTCSDKLMVVPGMDPYWEAAGSDTPWEIFDFPGFTLTEANGFVTQIDREHLGTAEIENQTGEYAYVDSYGDLKVASITSPQGNTTFFEDDFIYTTDAQQNKTPVMQLTRNEQGKVIRMETTSTPKIVKLLEYDALGNLTATYRGVNGEEPTLHRRFFYGDGLTRHHITKVQDAAGNTLAQVQYDANGRMVAMNGSASFSTETNVFDGVQSQVDALGNETVNIFDANGYIAKQILPDGHSILYQHDANGNETQITDQLGNTTRYEYNAQGQITQQTNPLGETTRYQYDNGQCTAITNPNGGTTTYSVTSDGRLTAICNEQGNILRISRDTAGNATTLSHNGVDYWNEYDSQGRLLSQGSELGPRMDYSYNTLGKQDSISATYLHPETNQEISFSTHYDFDSNGKPIQESCSTGKWKRYAYDTKGRLISSTDDTGHTTAFKYDTADHVIESVQDGTLIQRSGYDAAGKLIFQTTAQSFDTYSDSLVFEQVNIYRYDVMGRVLETSVAQNVNVTIQHQEGESYTASIPSGVSGNTIASSQRDAKGQLLSQQDSLGFSTAFHYDALGQVTAVKDHFDNVTNCTYATGGRVSSITLPGDYTTRFTYDAFGQCTQITLPNSATKKMKWDSLGHVTEQTNELGLITAFSYAQDEQLTQVTQNGNTLTLDYDSLGNVQSVQTPGNTITRYEHDPIGRCTEIQLPLGQKTHFTYDNIQRTPVQVQYPDGNHCVATFTPEGWMATNTFHPQDDSDQPTIIYNYSYTPGGLLESITRKSGEATTTTYCQYNSKGLKLSENRDGDTLRWSYSLDDKLTGYETPLAAVTISRDITEPRYDKLFSRSPAGNHSPLSVSYTPTGQIATVKRPDGTQRIYSYDAMGLPVLVTEQDAHGATLFSSQGTRDKAGHLTEILDTWNLEASQGSTQRQLQYTIQGRLAKVVSTSTQPEENYTVAYTYDKNGNLVKLQKTISKKKKTYTRTYDDNDRLLSIQSPEGTTRLTWSANGCLLSVQYPNQEIVNYTWNAENKLIQVNTPNLIIDYIYDATGTLAQERRTTNQQTQLHTLRFSTAQENLPSIPLDHISTSPDGNSTSSHLLFEGTYLGELTTDGIVTALTDITGSVRAVITAQGSTSYTAYSPYGMPIYEHSSSHIGFVSQWQDADTGLIYLHNRFYSPELAIFLSPDSATPDYREINSLNRYAYCNSDPVNRLDPNGTFSLCSIMSTMSTLFSLDMSLIVSINTLGAGVQIMANYYSSFDLDFDEKLFYDATRIFDLYRKKHRNATVIVHGVGYHDVGYADDFINLLQKRCSDQDITSYLWSGFVNLLIHAVPTVYQHRMGVAGLTYALRAMLLKGYDNVNVVSHSWGTVLSKEVLIANDIKLGLLATMGSPLPASSAQLIANPTPMSGTLPSFSGKYRSWQNYYYLSDPVVHLRFDTAPVMWSSLLNPALFWSSIPTQINLPCPAAIWSHSNYWEDPIVLQGLSQTLNAQ